VIGLAEQIVCDAGVATAFGVGFTVMVNVCGVPGQPFADGVTVIFPEIGAVPGFVAVNVGNVEPFPLAPSPMAVFEFVQLNVVPATLLVKFSVPVDTVALLQYAAFAGTVATGVGFTKTVAVIGAPGVQPNAVGVIVNVTVTGAFVVFVNVPDIFPLPLAAIPVTLAVLFLVQL